MISLNNFRQLAWTEESWFWKKFFFEIAQGNKLYCENDGRRWRGRTSAKAKHRSHILQALRPG